MRSLLFAWPALLMLLAPQSDSGARVERQPHRVGVFFWHRSANDLAAFEGIRRAFEIAGVEHEFVVHHADGDETRARRLLDECTDEKLDVLFTMGTRATFLAQGWVGRLPIVFTAVTNPVEAGIVSSWTKRYERSSTLVRLTGTSNWIPPDTVLHVFRLAVPTLRRLGVLRSSESGYVSEVELRGLRSAVAKTKKPLEIVETIFDRRYGIEAAVADLLAKDVDAVWIPIDFTIYQQSEQILEAMSGKGIPVLSSSLRATKDAAIAGIVVDYELLGRKAGALALDILVRGAEPARIPVETMKGYQIVVNMTAAKRYGYELPLPLLVVADQVLVEESAQDSAKDR